MNMDSSSRSDTRSLFEDNTRPRLFFGPDDLPALREKVKRGTCGRVFAEILKRCERYTDAGADDYIDPSKSVPELLEGLGGGQMNKTGDALHCLAFAYALSEEERWSEPARALLRTIVESPDTPMELCHATLANQVTIAFDVLCPVMDERERRRVDEFMRVRIRDYRENHLHSPKVHHWGVGCNVFWRNFEKYVLLLAATWRPDEDREQIPDLLSFLRRGLHMGIDEGGAIYEGPGYGWRDAEWLSYIAEVLYRMGVANLWEEEPRFASLFRHWAYIVLPGGYGQNNYCDAGRTRPDRPHIGMLLAARRLNDPVLQWVWEKLAPYGPVEGWDPAPQRYTWSLGQTILWEDEEAEALPPSEAGYATSRLSGRAGVMTMRSGWGDDDLYLSLLASERTRGNFIHQQVDAGHFSLFALGEAFSIDSGYGDIQGRYHSVMMPNGEEPSRAPHGFGQMFFGGRIEAFGASSGVDYACVNTAEQWECHWAYRHALLVKAPGADPYVVLFDNVNFDPEYRRYLWLMNSEPGNRIGIDQEDERAAVFGKQHRLELAWCYATADQYDPPHWLRLGSDEIDSRPWSGPGYINDGATGRLLEFCPAGGWTTGRGRRPRLEAELHGLNGQLLTALIPRRDTEDPVPIERIHGKDQLGFVLRLGDVTDTVVAGLHSRRIDIGGMQGEASLAVVRRDGNGEATWWAAADAFSLAVDGKEVLPRQGECLTLTESD